MHSKTILMYSEGYDLIEIAEENHLPNESTVIEDILTYKEMCKVLRGKKSFTFNTSFKEMIVDRYLSGQSFKSIATEIQLSTSTVSKYLKEAGVKLGKGNSLAQEYTVIQNWDDFNCCPTCNSEREVRHLGLHNQIERDHEPTHSYCSECYTEWYEENKETRKVVWHAIN